MPQGSIDVGDQQEFSDADFRIVDNADQSKKLALQLSGLTTATKRTWTVADKDGTVAMTSDITTTTAASQSDQETSTSNTVMVTPAVQQFHPSAAKFWSVQGNTGTLNASYNVTSRTDNGVGDQTITIATDFSSANWSAFFFASPSSAPANAQGAQRIPMIVAKAAGSVQGNTYTLATTPALADPGSDYSFIGFGDQ